MQMPDTRGTIVIGLFALTAGIFLALAVNPALSDNTLFDTLATLVVGSGGLLSAIGFYFGASQSNAKKDDTISTLVGQTPQAPVVSAEVTETLPQTQTKGT